MAWSGKKRSVWKENPVVLAAAISLALHLSIFGGWKIGQRFGWWKNSHLPSWLQKISQSLAKAPEAKKFLQQVNRESPPLIFVDVDPQLSIKEPPKNAKMYGAANTQVASKKPAEADVPEVPGKQDKVIKTVENEKPKAQPLQPAPAKPEETEELEAKSRPKEKQVVGDLAVAKPQDQNKTSPEKTKEDDGETEKKARVRPRPLDQVKAGAQGEKMKQEGGSKRLALEPSFDVKLTAFGNYDREFIAAVRQRWYHLLENRNTVPGKIVVEFRLNYDGRVTDLTVAENTTQNIMLELICTGAISDPSPYDPWPKEMRREMKSDHREVRFTFYYE
ncbi:MAG: hypothetical protein ABIP71_10695 [Verrucomicrobiota bacterium]